MLTTATLLQLCLNNRGRHLHNVCWCSFICVFSKNCCFSPRKNQNHYVLIISHVSHHTTLIS